MYKKFSLLDEPYIELLCGVSNSGKSTYVQKEYPFGFNGLVLSRDNLVIKYGSGNNYNESWNSLTDQDHRNIDIELKKQYDFALQKNKNIIVDMTNLTIERRALWLNKLPGYYIRRIRLFLTSFDEIKKRNKAQAKEKFIPEYVLESMLERFQYPKKKEFDELILENS